MGDGRGKVCVGGWMDEWMYNKNGCIWMDGWLVWMDGLYGLDVMYVVY